MKGYKVFNNDWTCRNFQYEVGKTYEMDEKPICCERGFHFCEKASDCFQYYSFNPNNKVAEVEALGDIDTSNNDSKCSTNKIHIIREITWQEVLDLVNLGKGCTGLCNSGDRNSGNRNSGDWNSGNWNSGDCNSGNCNVGSFNSGSWNIGYGNTGRLNIGKWNSGDFNKASYSVGCFNTQDRQLFFFDKPTDMTFDQWRHSAAYYLLLSSDLKPTVWIPLEDMTDAEKKQHTESYTTGGYLKVRDNNDRFIEWWNNLTDDEKDIIKSIPNFDPEKFFKITGIRVED